jgi:hypothetical protein
MIGANFGQRIYAVSMYQRFSGFRNKVPADFSTMAPLRLLENFTETITENDSPGALQMTFWFKVQQFSLSQVADHRSRSNPGLLSYAQRDVLDFVDCKSPFEFHSSGNNKVPCLWRC